MLFKELVSWKWTSFILFLCFRKLQLNWSFLHSLKKSTSQNCAWQPSAFSRPCAPPTIRTQSTSWVRVVDTEIECDISLIEYFVEICTAAPQEMCMYEECAKTALSEVVDGFQTPFSVIDLFLGQDLADVSNDLLQVCDRCIIPTQDKSQTL